MKQLQNHKILLTNEYFEKPIRVLPWSLFRLNKVYWEPLQRRRLILCDSLLCELWLYHRMVIEMVGKNQKMNNEKIKIKMKEYKGPEYNYSIPSNQSRWTQTIQGINNPLKEKRGEKLSYMSVAKEISKPPFLAPEVQWASKFTIQKTVDWSPRRREERK